MPSSKGKSRSSVQGTVGAGWAAEHEGAEDVQALAVLEALGAVGEEVCMAVEPAVPKTSEAPDAGDAKVGNMLKVKTLSMLVKPPRVKRFWRL
ncbi:MAG: hypothetical protein ACKPKO_09145 [Candidatus Fonsibacter sp.]